MADSALAKKRLSINLSFLNLAKLTSTPKSPKIFNDPNGVVGLQILAALNHDDDHHRQDSIFINGFSSGLVPISPKFSSNPIPIFTNNKPFDKNLTIEEMELCEEYTCVITHVGDRLIKKREYFEADLLGNDEHEVCDRIFVVSDNTISYGAGGAGGFLNTCFLCDKMLDGLDIFMYRGEKAFCSVECRHNHIANDEGKEKRHHRSGKRKPMDCSASPCSASTSPMQFCAGVAAA